MLYKGFITMNDGYQTSTLSQSTEADVLRIARGQMKVRNHYYKKDGIDFGQHGKWFNFEEEHGGLKELVIVKYTETGRKIITEL
jgi:hypothetical protein